MRLLAVLLLAASAAAPVFADVIVVSHGASHSYAARHGRGPRSACLHALLGAAPAFSAPG